MANTIIAPEIFAKMVIANRDRKNVFLPHTNRDYSGELAQHGKSVTVQTLPTFNMSANAITPGSGNQVGTGPGGVIPLTNAVITEESLLINGYSNLRIQLSKFEKTQSNISLEIKLAERFAEAEARLMDEQIRDQVLVTQVADIPTANKINASTPVVITKTNVFAEIEKMRVALAEQNVTDNLVLFVAPSVQSILLQSGILDNSDEGLKARYRGYMGMISGVIVIASNALTASKEMIMMAENAINVVVQLQDYDVRPGADGLYDNLLAEVVWGMKIFGENAKAIAINYVASVS